jgi:hypothetical protein
MRRLVLVFAALAAAATAADARPRQSLVNPDPQASGGTLIPRGVLLGVATGVNALGTSIIAYEVATGKKALAATAVSVLLTAPTIAYTLTEIRSDPGDALLWGSAVWSTAILTKAVIDLIRHHDPASERSNNRVIIQPTFDPSTRKPSIGVDFVGQF